MKYPVLKAVLGLAMLVVAGAWAAPASAQATRTWVSGVGDDANPCSRTAPCKTFPGAISKTAPGGEINCLDPGGFAGLTITKSITIVCHFTEAGILVSGTNGINVNAGVNDVVILRGIEFEGLGSAPNGIRVFQVGTLHVMDSTISDFRGTAGSGILFSPSNPNAQLIVTNTYLSENGNGASNGGIVILPTATSGTARVTLDNVRATGNVGSGVRVDTTSTPTGASIQVTIQNSTINNNANGLLVVTPATTGQATVLVTDTSVSNNVGLGLVGNGATARLRVGRTTITGNNNGVVAGGGAIVNSYGNNFLDGNVSNGAFTAPVIPSS